MALGEVETFVRSIRVAHAAVPHAGHELIAEGVLLHRKLIYVKRLGTESLEGFRIAQKRAEGQTAASVEEVSFIT